MSAGNEGIASRLDSCCEMRTDAFRLWKTNSIANGSASKSVSNAMQFCERLDTLHKELESFETQMSLQDKEKYGTALESEYVALTEQRCGVKDFLDGAQLLEWTIGWIDQTFQATRGVDHGPNIEASILGSQNTFSVKLDSWLKKQCDSIYVPFVKSMLVWVTDVQESYNESHLRGFCQPSLQDQALNRQLHLRIAKRTMQALVSVPPASTTPSFAAAGTNSSNSLAKHGEALTKLMEQLTASPKKTVKAFVTAHCKAMSKFSCLPPQGSSSASQSEPST